MRYKVLTAVIMKIAVFWDVTPGSLVDVYRCFRDMFLINYFHR